MGKTGVILSWTVVVCILAGVLAHVAYITRTEEMLADRPFRDDAFYALTVSRNIALGNGISVSDGEIPTNGIQPFFVVLCSLIYEITPDRYQALRLVHGLHLVIHILCAAALFSLVRLLTGGKRAAWIAAALWMCSYNIMKESSNGLETGLYLLMLIISFRLYLWYSALEKPGFLRGFLFGAFLGSVTLTRIDSVIFTAAIAFHYLFIAGTEGRKGWRTACERLMAGPVPWAAGWLAVTMPWWIYNINLTGHPFPVSGLVQTMNYNSSLSSLVSEILRNIWYGVHVVLDNLLFLLWVPLRAIYSVNPMSLGLLLLKAVLLAAIIVIAARSIGKGAFSRLLPWRKVSFYPLFLLGLFLFYTLYFNVEWYMNRYLVPFSVFTALLLSALLARLRSGLVAGFLAAVLVFDIAVIAWTYSTPYNTMYLYHWGWVRENVTDETWIGAGQSGTLGYFHDRTINSDGKVNTEIFGLPSGQMGRYLEERDVAYFLEWGESFVFQDSTFLERYEYLYDFGTTQVWRRKSLSLN